MTPGLPGSDWSGLERGGRDHLLGEALSLVVRALGLGLPGPGRRGVCGRVAFVSQL